MFREFCAEFTAEINRLRMQEWASQAAWEAELPRIDRSWTGSSKRPRRRAGLEVKDRMIDLEARKTELTSLLATAHEPPPLLHPNMAEVWRQRIGALHEALQDEASKAQAFEVLRSLIDRVTLVPEDGQLAIVLRGELAAMLAFSANKKRSPSNGPTLKRNYRWLRGRQPT